MRYFVRLDGNNQPVMLYRFNLDDPNSVSEQSWSRGSWGASDSIAEALFKGSMDYDEITEELAREAFPDAFDK